MTNEKKKGDLQITKTDVATGELLPDAGFTISSVTPFLTISPLLGSSFVPKFWLIANLALGINSPDTCSKRL